MNSENPGRVGPYIILRELTQGSFPPIFKAQAENLLGKIVVIKKLMDGASGAEALRHALKNEAQTLSQLNHPGIIKIFEYVEDETGIYSVLEYVECWNLSSLVELQRRKEKKLREWFSVWVIAELCRIVHYLHYCQITHGDIGAKNILLTSEGFIKLIDFTRAAPAEESARRQDIISIGTLTYELLTGETFNQVKPKPLPLKEISDVFNLALAMKSDKPIPSANELYKSIALYMHLKFPGLIAADIAEYLKSINAST